MKVTKGAIREYVADALKPTSPTESDPQPANVSAVVDPQKFDTDPTSDTHKPKDRRELKASMTSLLGDVSDDNAASAYDTIKTSLEKEKEKRDKDMEKSEAIIRKTIRAIIAEEMSFNEDHDDGDSDETEAPNQSSLEGATFEKIAKEAGFSIAGAKQFVEKAMKRFKFMFQMMQEEPEDVEIFVLENMVKYIDYLASSDELQPDEVELLKAHPKVIEELPGFREFLHKAIRKEMKNTDIDDEEVA